jgi:hypothetical protein
MSLDVQVQILSVDTGNFYSNREASLHWLNHKLRIERNELKKKEEQVINALSEYGIDKTELDSITKCEYDFNSFEDNASVVSMLCDEYNKIKELLKLKNQKIKESKDRLLELL